MCHTTRKQEIETPESEKKKQKQKQTEKKKMLMMTMKELNWRQKTVSWKSQQIHIFIHFTFVHER